MGRHGGNNKKKNRGRSGTNANVNANRSIASNPNPTMEKETVNLWPDPAKPPIQPGATALLRGLQSRPELNLQEVTIQQVLDNGRVAVKYVLLPGSRLAKTETIAVKPENLDVQWGGSKTKWNSAQGLELCPLCRVTEMITERCVDQNAGIWSCCGGKTCYECEVKLGPENNRCPLCRAESLGTDEEQARNTRARAAQGDANAMYNLGSFYDHGRYGVPKDQATARLWYEKAALKGEARAANNLACSHRDGEGGPVDKVQATKWFRVAAELGHVQAGTNLGLAYMRGDGVAQDLEQAEFWLQNGANNGDGLAAMQLRMLNFIK